MGSRPDLEALWGEDNLYSSEEEEEEEENDDDVNNWASFNSGVAQHYLFLIDCHSEMWKTTKRGGNAVKDVLSFVQNFVRSNVQESVQFHTGKRNGICVLLYNTKNRKPKELEESDGEDSKDGTNEGENNSSDYVEPDFYSNQRKSTVHELIPVSKPGVDTVQTIRETLKDLDSLEKEYAQPEEECRECDQCLLQLALAKGVDLLEKETFVHTKSTSSSPKRDRIQIWVWSNQDNPVRGNEMRACVKDLKDDGMYNLVLWGLNHADGSPFDYSVFYDEAFEDHMMQKPLRGKALDDDVEDLWEIVEPELQTFWKPTRPTYRQLPLLLPDWKEAGMQKENSYSLDWYRVSRTSKEPNKVSVHNESGQKLETLTQWMAGTEIVFERITGVKSKPPKDRVRSFVPFGTDRVPITAKEKKEIKKGSNSLSEFPGLVLIGFRPRTAIPDFLFTEAPYICVPPSLLKKDDTDAEKNHQNNIQALVSLHRAMEEEHVVAIGELLTRTSSTCRTVSLLPLPSKRDVTMDDDADDDGEGEPEPWPPFSFLATPLPFENEIREPKAQNSEEEEDVEGTKSSSPDIEPLVEAVAAIMKKQTLGDAEIGLDFQNPKLTEYWRAVTALAYSDLIAEESTDERDLYGGSILDQEAVLEAVGTEIESFKSLLPEPLARSAVGKKKTAGKRKKVEVVADNTGIDWVELLRADEIGGKKTKLKDLQTYLKSVGEVSSGTKGVLADKVIRHLRKEQERKAQQMNVEN